MRKRQKIILFVFTALTLLAFSALAARYTKKNGDAAPQSSIILQKTEDIDGDGFAETIYLYGFENTDGMYENLTVTVKTTAGGLMKKASADYLRGKNPRMEIGDCTNDGKKEILIRLAPHTAVFDFSSPVPFNLFSPEKNSGIRTRPTLSPKFTIQAVIAEKQNTLCLKHNKNALISQGVFSADGLPAADALLNINPYSEVHLKNGGLTGIQPITVNACSEPICYIVSELNYVKNSWQVSSWYLTESPPIPQP